MEKEDLKCSPIFEDAHPKDVGCVWVTSPGARLPGAASPLWVQDVPQGAVGLLGLSWGSHEMTFSCLNTS